MQLPRSYGPGSASFVPARREPSRGPWRSGFTLVEVLIVVSIIAILASLSLAGVRIIQHRTKVAMTTSEVKQFEQALERYETDEKLLPAQGARGARRLSAEDNLFPLLFNALLGERKPRGPGGSGAPYVKLDGSRIVVKNESYDSSIDEPDARFRPATRSEVDDPKTDKYYLDHFGSPYIYRCNRGKPPEPFMVNPKTFDFYSIGPNGEDETVLGEDADVESDDIVSG